MGSELQSSAAAKHAGANPGCHPQAQARCRGRGGRSSRVVGAAAGDEHNGARDRDRGAADAQRDGGGVGGLVRPPRPANRESWSFFDARVSSSPFCFARYPSSIATPSAMTPAAISDQPTAVRACDGGSGGTTGGGGGGGGGGFRWRRLDLDNRRRLGDHRRWRRGDGGRGLAALFNQLLLIRNLALDVLAVARSGRCARGDKVVAHSLCRAGRRAGTPGRCCRAWVGHRLISYAFWYSSIASWYFCRS